MNSTTHYSLLTAHSPKPKVLVFSGFGLNCEEETKFAFETAGGSADIVHINDLRDNPTKLRDYQIIAIPGGFAYGDHTGSGKAYGNLVKEYLSDELKTFLERDTLLIAICNGFQVATNAGILPGALIANDSARYHTRWVDLEVRGMSPWLSGISKLSVPIAHGEGKFIASTETLADMQKNDQIALTYTRGEIAEFFDMAGNPNGSTLNIAGITAYDGRVLGLMPHPERALRFTQLPHWSYLKAQLKSGETSPEEASGLQIFKNAISYFTSI